MKVCVTQEDINMGKKGHPNACPVALAMRRTFKDLPIDLWPVSGTIYTSQRITATGINTKRHWSMPSCVRQFIFNFDEGVEVKPFEFEL